MIPLDTSPRALAFRAAYDQQIRTRPGSANGGVVDRIGPVIRKVGFEGDGMLFYQGGGGDDLDELIASQVEHFTKLDRQVEWKHHAYDEPADLPARLTTAGFAPEEAECLLIGDVADLATEPALPTGVTLRDVTSRADLARIQAMEEAVWGVPHDWLPEALTRAIADDDPATVVVAEAAGQLVSASWIRCHTGTEFASLWGGSTLPEWRGRGIYRALVAHRARLAADGGYRYLQVDASPDSRGILARLGFLPVAVTIPYIWRPHHD